MTSRCHTYKNKTSPQPQYSSTAPARGMFEARPFVVSLPKAASSQPKQNLNQSLMRTEHYGHNLSRMQLAEPSTQTVVQPKMERGERLQYQKPAAPRIQFNKQMRPDSFSHPLPPTSQSGQQLLGHELTHVVQQRSGQVNATTQAQGSPVNDQQELEVQADKLGEMAARGETVSSRIGRPVSSPGGMVQRKVDVVQCGKDRLKKPKSLQGKDPITGGDATFHHNLPYSQVLTDKNAATGNPALENNVAKWATRPTSGNINPAPSDKAVAWAGHNGFMGPLPELRADDPGDKLDTHFTASGTVTPNSEAAMVYHAMGGIHQPAQNAELMARLQLIASGRHDQPAPMNPKEWTPASTVGGTTKYKQTGRPPDWDSRTDDERLDYPADIRMSKFFEDL